MTTERAGVIIIRDERVVLIERHRCGRQYWVIPGGRVEPGESVDEAARREAEEELGVSVELGTLRIRIDHRGEDGSIQRHWYFDASVPVDEIQFVGPEAVSAKRGTYSAVWLGLPELNVGATHPSAVALLIAQTHGVWPDSLINIDEK